jgi:hypothetical protein
MRTRISRTGKQQVLLGVWIDKSIYDELESTAKRRETTVADAIRNLLARSVEAERYRPDAEQILDDLLNLKEAERVQLRQQLHGAGRRKAMQLAALQRTKALKPATEAGRTLKNKSGE